MDTKSIFEYKHEKMQTELEEWSCNIYNVKEDAFYDAEAEDAISCSECYQLTVKLIKHQIKHHHSGNLNHCRKILSILQNITSKTFESDLNFYVEIVTNIKQTNTIKLETSSIESKSFNNVEENTNQNQTVNRFKQFSSEICNKNESQESISSVNKLDDYCENHQYNGLSNNDLSNNDFNITVIELPIIPKERKSFTCDICGYTTFGNKTIIRKHLQQKHIKKLNVKDELFEPQHHPEKEFICKICGKTFIRKVKYIEHLRTHSIEQPFSCYFCSKLFNSKKSLRSHRCTKKLKQEPSIKHILCDMCGREYQNRKCLLQHLKTHQIKPVYKCTICNREYKNKESFREHEHFHTGEKPYKCLYGCDQAFAHVSNRKQHHRSFHQPEKQFPCEICGKTLTRKTGYIEHMRTHTGEQPYVCEFCSRPFSSKKTLRNHRRIHTGERPYKCERCHKTFIEHKALKKHMERKTLCAITIVS